MSELLKESDYRDKGNVLVRVGHDSSTETEYISEIALKTDSGYKNVVQSYIFTAAKYDFSVYEKRILYRIIQCFQFQLEGKKLDKGFLIDKNLWGDVIIVLPLSSLLADKDDEHYSRIKNALKGLQKRLIEYETNDDKGIWTSLALIIKPKIDRYSRTVRFRLHQEVYEVLLDFTKGYRRYELEAAMVFRSVYAMRFYELLSGQTTPLTYNIENLRAMLRLENKYKLVKDFIKYVIKAAQKELEKKSLYSFTYEPVYEKERINPKGGRKKIIGITFTPVHCPEQRNKLLAYKDLRDGFNLLEVLLDEEIQILLSLGFTEQELQNNYLIFEQYSSSRKNGYPVRSIIEIVKYVKAYSDSFRDLKAYMIGALRTEVNKHGSVFAQTKSLSSHGTVPVSSIALPLVDKISRPKNPDMGNPLQEKKGFDKKRAESLRSFLEDYLPIEDVEKGVSYFMEHGTERLNRIVILCEGKKDKIRECIQILIK